jgi:riboflavin kinase / FMN adenylyltransferase
MYKIFGLKNRVINTIGLGVFDGMHRGHQIIANKSDFLLTLYPHPDWFLGKNHELKMINSLREQRFYFKDLLVLHFNEYIAGLSAKDFLDEIIYKKLRPKKIVVGEDYGFGAKACGDVVFLKKWCEQMGLDLEVIPLLSYKDQAVKSSLIRSQINENCFDKAIDLLGHSFLIIGKVVKGEGRGRTLGYPTANIKVPAYKLIPTKGVYRGIVVVNKQKYSCFTYIGKKPTFGRQDLGIEVYIQGFKGDIYNKQIKVFLESKIRDERKFASEQELKAQIKKDLESS